MLENSNQGLVPESNEEQRARLGHEAIKFFEVEAVPSESAVAEKLKEMGCEIVAETLSVKPRYQDAALMRSGGMSVPRLYQNRR